MYKSAAREEVIFVSAQKPPTTGSSMGPHAPDWKEGDMQASLSGQLKHCASAIAPACSFTSCLAA